MRGSLILRGDSHHKLPPETELRSPWGSLRSGESGIASDFLLHTFPHGGFLKISLLAPSTAGIKQQDFPAVSRRIASTPGKEALFPSVSQANLVPTHLLGLYLTAQPNVSKYEGCPPSAVLTLQSRERVEGLHFLVIPRERSMEFQELGLALH